MVLRARTLTLTLCAACGVWLGCADTDDTGPQPIAQTNDSAELVPRWVHRYMPKHEPKYSVELDVWRPEAEVPRTRETEPGMVVWEVSEYSPGTPTTDEQQRAADDIVERCFAAAVEHGWDRIERGLSDGYRSVDRHHYRNDEYMLDDRVLDPDHPEVLMYYATPPDGRLKLAGFMFYAIDRESRGPQFGGPTTIWHYHSWFRPQCVLDGLAIEWSVAGKCGPDRGVPSHFSGEMMHVWLLERPEGRFATPMTIPYSVLGPLLDKRMKERGF